MNLRTAAFFTLLLAFGVGAAPAHADVKLPALLSDGAVLQQKTPARIWGAADPGEIVTVSFRGEKRIATAGADGRWEVMLPPLTAGGPDNLTVQGKNSLTVKDVLVGEVWICSGQSNMEFRLSGAAGAAAEIAASSDPQLRMFTVDRKTAAAPVADVKGAWQSAGPDTAAGFSAVGYYFAKALRAARKVPIGMIHSSWGGTPIEAWTRKEVLLANGLPASAFKAVDKTSPQYVAEHTRYQEALARWKAAGSPQFCAERPVSTEAAGWEKPELDDSGWQPFPLPQNWENSGIAEYANLDGGVWFRKSVEVPAAFAGRPATLSLGAIDDYDSTYWNGVKVGATGKETRDAWSAPRVYGIPAGILKAGKNVVAVRVWDTGGLGGITGPGETMYLEAHSADGSTVQRLPLAGEWRSKIEFAQPSNPGEPPSDNDPNAPSVLYNGMIAPLTPYTIKGALWYQGESNAYNATAYRHELPDLIQNWRDDWNLPRFPFLIVQLASYLAINPQPEDTDWARLREAQWMATYALPNVGMAVIDDLGDEKNIHPTRKAPVGDRLALLARRIAYGEKIVDEGPVYKKMAIEGDHIVLTFDSVGEGLAARATDSNDKPVPNGKLVGFSISGADGKFVWADARITAKDTVTVSAASIPRPIAVRFGWANFPVVNLYNSADLPAVPFRTDAK